MRKYLLIVLIIPNLLFAKLYTADTSLIKQNIHASAHEYALDGNKECDLYNHTHEHYHSAGTTAHAHQHSHGKTMVNAIDFLFDNEVINITTFSTPKESITSADMLISNLFIEEVFRPPIH